MLILYRFDFFLRREDKKELLRGNHADIEDLLYEHS